MQRRKAGAQLVRVLIDASALPPLRGGVGRYVDELIAHLPQVSVDTAVVCQRRDVELYTAAVGRRNISVVPSWASSAPLRLLWEQVDLPRIIRARQPDILHSPHYTMPLVNGGRRGSDWMADRIVGYPFRRAFLSTPSAGTGRSLFNSETTRSIQATSRMVTLGQSSSRSARGLAS